MMKLHVLNTEDFKLDGGASFGVVPKSIWSMLIQPDKDNYINVCNRLLLIETGDRRILIDTGIGNKQDEKYLSHFQITGHTLEEALAVKGFVPNDITDIILTHLHFDHVGGCLRYNADRTKTEFTFPNATYYCSKAQWEWAVNPNFREKAAYLPENYMPLFESGKLEFIMKEGLFCEGVSLMMLNGHTEGQVIPVIDYKGRKIVFMADFIATAEQIPIAYVPAFDVRPLLSYQEKTEFLEKALNNNYILFFEHDPRHECCDLQQTKKGIRMKEHFILSDIS